MCSIYCIWEKTIRESGLFKEKSGMKISVRLITSLCYANDTTMLLESKDFTLEIIATLPLDVTKSYTVYL